MGRMIYYAILFGVLLSWAMGTFYLKEQYYIHSLLVIAGLMLAFRYVYKLRPVRA